MKQNVGFIGFGNMAQAMADGLLASGRINGEQLFACAKHWDSLCKNTQMRGMHPCRSTQDTVQKSDIVFLAVKPQQIPDITREIADLLEGKIVISLAAGMLFDAYEVLFHEGTHHLSIIPNMPVSVCEGILLWEQKHSLHEEEQHIVQELLSGIGLIQELESDQMTIGATVSGCGPAFAAMFVEAMGDGAVMHGLPRAAAYRLCAQMMAGTAKLLNSNNLHPGIMKDKVSAPKGTTIQGIAELEHGGFRNALIQAVDRIEQYRKTNI